MARTDTQKAGQPPGARLVPGVAALLLAGLGVILVWQPEPDALPPVAAFAGRFHLLVLHFPIGLLAVALLLTLGHWAPLARRLPAAPPVVLLWIIGMGALSAWLAAVCGWFLAHSGGYQGETLTRHFYSGAACAAVALLAWVAALQWAAQPGSGASRGGVLALLAAANGLVVLAGHWGGTLTHGEGFLLEHAPSWLRQAAGLPARGAAGGSAALADQPVYTAAIHPLLKKYCIECHNEQRAKGDLRFDTYAETMKSLTPGKPAESLLWQRMRLPLDDDDHMPPKNKPQPPPEALALLEWWIAAGAPEQATLRKLNPPAAIRQHLRLD